MIILHGSGLSHFQQLSSVWPRLPRVNECSASQSANHKLGLTFHVMQMATIPSSAVDLPAGGLELARGQHGGGSRFGAANSQSPSASRLDIPIDGRWLLCGGGLSRGRWIDEESGRDA